MKLNLKTATLGTLLVAPMVLAFAHTTTAKAATVAEATTSPYSQLYRENGSKVSNRALAPNTYWKVGRSEAINGQIMYLVGGDEWLSANDSVLQGQTQESPNGTLLACQVYGGTVNLYNNQTKSQSNRALANGSDWLVGHIYKNSRGQVFAQVSTYEYVDASRVHFNADPNPKIEYNANFGINDSNTDNGSNTNNGGSSSNNNSQDSNSNNQNGSTTPDNGSNGSNSGNTGNTTPSTDNGGDPLNVAANVDQVRQQVLASINAERAANGAEPLTLDSTLNDGAMIRAQEASQRMGHTRPNGQPFNTVFPESMRNKLGENISTHFAPKSSINDIVQEELTSYKGEGKSDSTHTTHYGNYIRSDYKTIGIGIYYEPTTGYTGTNGTYYLVEDFSL